MQPQFFAGCLPVSHHQSNWPPAYATNFMMVSPRTQSRHGSLPGHQHHRQTQHANKKSDRSENNRVKNVKPVSTSPTATENTNRRHPDGAGRARSTSCQCVQKGLLMKAMQMQANAYAYGCQFYYRQLSGVAQDRYDAEICNG